MAKFVKMGRFDVSENQVWTSISTVLKCAYAPNCLDLLSSVL